MRWLEVKDLEILINTYGNVIYGFCIKLTLNKADADDLYQQTFLKALEIKEKIDNNNNPKSYIISISIGIWKNQKRKRARHKRIISALDIDQDAFNTWGEHCDISNTIYNKELQRQVNIIVSNLDDKFRLPILMYYNSDMCVSEIASILKLSQGTVKSRLYNARQIIKKNLEERGYCSYE